MFSTATIMIAVCGVGWAKKYESVLSLELAWAHMPMGIERPNTKFGPILLIPGSATGCP